MAIPSWFKRFLKKGADSQDDMAILGDEDAPSRPFWNNKTKIAAGVLAYVVLIGVLYGASLVFHEDKGDGTSRTARITIEQATPAADDVASVNQKLVGINTADRFRLEFRADDTRPRVALIITGIGLSEERTKKAILDLPPAVSLAISPYAQEAGFWLEQSVKNRHETFLMVPLQAKNFPNVDPGPLGLINTLPVEQRTQRLETISRISNEHLGYITGNGNQFTANIQNLKDLYRYAVGQNAVLIEDVLEEGAIASRADFRGDLYVKSSLRIDEIAQAEAILGQLKALESRARKNGFAIGTAFGYPVTIAVVERWAKTFNENSDVALAPVSAVMEMRNARRL